MLDADWLEPQSADRALSLPAACYVDPEFEQLERAAVFAKGWQLVAHAAQLANPGDHVVAQIGSVPLVIVRGEAELHLPQGRLRALHNVCRHRAGPLATCNGRGARSLVCAYHGWTYALDGQLRGAPEMHTAPGFDMGTLRLPSARVAEWQGLVFAALDGARNDGGHEFDALVAGIGARLAIHELLTYAFDRRVSYEIRCNWKVYVDNYLEGYHLPRVHPALNRLLDYRSYSTELADWHSLQSSPLVSTIGPYRGSADGAPEALYWWLWPNTMLNVLPQRLQTNRVVPLDAQRCRVDFDYYYAPGAGIAEDDRAFADSVQAEDTAICEAVQRGLDSGSYVAGRLNPARESGVWHFHELLRSACRSEAVRQR
ncbi:MAG: Rieske 2Fe-2S domain-containing protein [Pseudomonadota bacterium]|nr:Rieske 2Fe-2S domain-containing protein [Pseudomonadota bacterium]